MFWNKESNLKIKFNKKNWKDNKYFIMRQLRNDTQDIFCLIWKTRVWAINMKEK